MKLSIITINYNNLEGLRRTIDSVMSQTWRDFEWILVDGGSTDGSKELIEEIAANPHSNISWWCSEPDKGIYNAMNKGILHAKGDYLNFMNSGDCFVDKSILEKFFNYIQKDIPESDILYGDCLECSENFKSVFRQAPPSLTLDFYVNRGYINHQSSFIKRALFDNELYDESYRLCADGNFFIRRILDGCKFSYVGFSVCRFYLGGASSEWASNSETQRYIQCNLSERFLDGDINSLVYFYWKKASYRKLITFFANILIFVDRSIGNLHFRKGKDV